jgi:hypothetical protein
VSDNPYQSPTETPLADSSAEQPGQVEQQRLGGFIVTVLILDCIPCMLRLYVYLYGLLHGRIQFPNGSAIAIFCLVLGTIVFAFSGNLLILLKKRSGILLAVAGFVLSLLAGGFSFLRAFPMSPPQDTTVAMWHAIQVSVLLFWAFWLVIYGVVVWTAAKRLGWVRRNVGRK